MFVNADTNTNKNAQSSTLEDNPPSFLYTGGKKIKQRKSISKFLKRELSKMGYSEKAIQEIGKWLPLE